MDIISDDLKKVLKEYILKCKQPMYFEKIPIEYDRFTGKPIRFEEKPVYPELNDAHIFISGGSGSELNFIPKKYSDELLRIWKPIIIDSEYMVIPVQNEYDVKCYWLHKYIDIR